MPRPTARALTMACLCASVGCGALPTRASAQEDFPKRRAGLWEVRSVGAQASGLPPTRICVGEGTDTAQNHLDRSVGSRGSCTLGAFRRAGQAWLAESTCREGRTVVTSRSIATGDFDASYRIDTLVSYDPPLGGVRREDKDALEATWLGPCAQGQKPGDMVVPGMGTLNMLDGGFRAEPPARGRAAERPRSDR
ncbi:MAG TPA: hypothetical protein PKB08_08640 [Burkholderiaceae bacterium]|nr:hypothetical protein [Burkholderiaceae bacterium]